MKKTGLIIAIAVLVAGAFFVFGVFLQKRIRSNGSSVNNEQSIGKNETVVDFQKGERIYQQKCAACHQVNGMGVSGAFPPLKGSDFLKNSTKKRLIDQVMNGSNGGLVVNGKKYATPMPPQVNNASDAVAVVNYILNTWGNHYGTASLQDAKGIKKTNKNRRHMMMNGGMMRNGGGMNRMNRN